VALVAACVLLLQGLFGAFAAGATTTGGPLDLFGNSLCMTAMDGTGQPADEHDHSAFPDCCTGLCGQFAPATLAERAPHSLFSPLAVTAQAGTPPRVTALPSVPGRDPGSPRAPPAAA
jgi:hypothetical protein